MSVPARGSQLRPKKLEPVPAKPFGQLARHWPSKRKALFWHKVQDEACSVFRMQVWQLLEQAQAPWKENPPEHKNEQFVRAAQTLSVLIVAGLCSYCAPALQGVSETQMRSLVSVGGVASYSELVWHAVSGLH